MGKHKSKGKLKQKISAVFKVAGDKSLKAKGKAKKVNTNLRKMNFKTKNQTTTSDEQLKNVKEMIYVNNKKIKKTVEIQPKKERPEPVDVDETVLEIQRLWN